MKQYDTWIGMGAGGNETWHMSDDSPKPPKKKRNWETIGFILFIGSAMVNIIFMITSLILNLPLWSLKLFSLLLIITQFIGGWVWVYNVAKRRDKL